MRFKKSELSAAFLIFGEWIGSTLNWPPFLTMPHLLVILYSTTNSKFCLIKIYSFGFPPINLKKATISFQDVHKLRARFSVQWALSSEDVLGLCAFILHSAFVVHRQKVPLIFKVSLVCSAKKLNGLCLIKRSSSDFSVFANKPLIFKDICVSSKFKLVSAAMLSAFFAFVEDLLAPAEGISVPKTLRLSVWPNRLSQTALSAKVVALNKFSDGLYWVG